MNLLYEGKAKKVFQGPEKGQYVLYFKDDATAFNAQKKAVIESKGILNQKISSYIFKYLAENGIQSHYIKTLSDREILVSAVDIIPLEAVVRNISAGSLCKRLGFPEKKEIKPPLVEFYYKKDELNDPILAEDHILMMNLASQEELRTIRTQSLKINELLTKFFLDLGITLADFKIEFGRDANGSILLADEISPDSCRLWDSKTHEILDKDRFRKDLGGLSQAYQEILTRISGGMNES